jgi:hypothetical protein
VIYDTDCGVCLWICRILLRIDLRGHLTFQGNDDVEKILRRNEKGEIEAVTRRRSSPPSWCSAPWWWSIPRAASTQEPRRRRGDPGLAARLLEAWLLRIPGLSLLFDLAYDAIAARRQNISVLMGKAACGIPLPPEDGGKRARGPRPRRTALDAHPPRPHRGLRELAALVLLASALGPDHQGQHAALPASRRAAARRRRRVAADDRALGRAHPGASQGPTRCYVIDAQTRGQKIVVDTLTGKEPIVDPGQMRGQGLGQLWSDYLARINQKEWVDFQKAFRDYMAKEGPRWSDKQGDEQVTGFDAYLVKQPIPPPGEARSPEAIAKEKLFTHSRGGKLNLEKSLPIFRPDLNKR